MRNEIKLLLLQLLSFHVVQSLGGLNSDGVSLLSFKYSVLRDPLSVLQDWNFTDETPCRWRGVSCEPRDGNVLRVVGLTLPSSELLGSVSFDLGLVEFLQRLDLSNNSLNGSIPVSLLRNKAIVSLDLSNNWISGGVPEITAASLETLRLSDNALAGKIPANLGALHNLSVVSMENNYLSGDLPSGLFNSVKTLDLSSNFFNGSLRSDFGGENLAYLNLSHNRITGAIPPDFAARIPVKAVVDLSFNLLAGPLPESELFSNQRTASFAGNPDLCVGLAKTPCSSIASSPSNSPPAIAAIPRTINSDPAGSTGPGNRERTGNKRSGLKPAAIIGITVGDIAGVLVLVLISICIYKARRKNNNSNHNNSKKSETNEVDVAREDWSETTESSSESRGFTRWSCLRKQVDEEESSFEEELSSGQDQRWRTQDKEKQGTLVTVDGGERELELETLLKASAYILGATGSSITYKAVLDDGTALAVRRIGESGLDRFKDFENRVRVVAKLVHPNLVRVRGFYWGADEKLIIYDFVPNGSLANARYRKVGLLPCHLPWEARLKIAKGVARGLAYLHEKKHVHGNLKPSNVLLGSDMEPKIGDFGLERLITGDVSNKAWGSARNFGSKRSTASRDSFPECTLGHSPSLSPSPSPSAFGISPYHAPESLRSLKPNPKWDVFSFGVILLELLTGKVVVLDDSGQGPAIIVDDKNRAIRMADVTIRGDLEGKEDVLLACFHLGYNCASLVPQKRPTMKEVLQQLEKFPSSCSTPPYYC